MNLRYRSFTGAVCAVLALPVLLGLTACLPSFPVPVGNPEKSRIDPYISGIWYAPDDEIFYVFEPYDKRTWLLTGLDISEDKDYCAEEFKSGASEDLDIDELERQMSDYEELIADIQRLGVDCYEGDRELTGIKVWRSKFGGEWFMTWEPMGAFSAESGFGAEEWVVFHIGKPGPNELSLRWINLDHPAWEKFEDVEDEDVTQRDIEKVIKKNAKDDSFYDDDYVLEFNRVPQEHYELLEEFLDDNF